MIILTNKLKDFPKLNLNKQQVSVIINDYYNGIKTSKLEKKYNFKRGTIDYIRKILSLKKYENPKYSNEHVGQAVKDLTSGMLLKDIVKKYNISEPTIKRYMAINNINYKSDHGRKNHFNKNFFNKIDTEAKAYFLGFIYADGSICKTDKTQTRENRLTINISEKDIEILKNFASAINYNDPKIQIYAPHESTYANNDMCRINLNSVELVDDLKKHGILSNKTLEISFPFKSMRKSLYKHFIRGFFDGDGCISNSSFSIIGNKEILLPIQEILMKNCNLNKTKLSDYPHKNVEIYDLKYGGNKQIKRIFDYLYSNSTVYLDRKYKKFVNLFS